MSFNNQLNADKLVNEFLGLCQGLIADDDVSYSEMEFLKKWLTNNQEKANSNFINQIADKIMIIERTNPNEHPDEQKALLKELCITLKDFTGSDYELGEFKKSNQLSIDQNADIFIDNHNFVLTGKFTRMSRKEIESQIYQLGGLVKRDVSSKTHFLVIGDYASTDWKHSSYGNKIKYAEKLRHDGIDIKIISEAQLYDALNNPEKPTNHQPHKSNEQYCSDTIQVGEDIKVNSTRNNQSMMTTIFGFLGVAFLVIGLLVTIVSVILLFTNEFSVGIFLFLTGMLLLYCGDICKNKFQAAE